MRGEKKRRRRDALFKKQNGLCYWCEEPMTIYHIKRGKMPDDGATIDHLRCRYNPTRYDPSDGEERTVLACFWCNSMRARKIEENTPRGELRANRKEALRRRAIVRSRQGHVMIAKSEAQQHGA